MFSSAIFCASMTSPIGSSPSGPKHQATVARRVCPARPRSSDVRDGCGNACRCRRPLLRNSHIFRLRKRLAERLTATMSVDEAWADATSASERCALYVLLGYRSGLRVSNTRRAASWFSSASCRLSASASVSLRARIASNSLRQSWSDRLRRASLNSPSRV